MDVTLVSSELSRQVLEVQHKYSLIADRIVKDGSHELCGLLPFVANHAEMVIRDKFSIRILVPYNYPRGMPAVWETEWKVPITYHRNPDGQLCLGTPVEIMLELSENPSLLEFVEQVVVRYLFGFSFWKKTGVMPFGERAHGAFGKMEFTRITLMFATVIK